MREIRESPSTNERNRTRQQSTWNQPKVRLSADQSVFKVYKGVKCFDFSHAKNIIVTGGERNTSRAHTTYARTLSLNYISNYTDYVCQDVHALILLLFKLCFSICNVAWYI